MCARALCVWLCSYFFLSSYNPPFVEKTRKHSVSPYNTIEIFPFYPRRTPRTFEFVAPRAPLRTIYNRAWMEAYK